MLSHKMPIAYKHAASDSGTRNYFVVVMYLSVSGGSCCFPFIFHLQVNL